MSYLDKYVAAFKLQQHIRLRRRVDSAEFKSTVTRWRVSAADIETGEEEEYEAQFFVVATGENNEPVLPVGITGFEGEAVHSCQFKTGKAYKGLDVLVVGSGNSGMEIAGDLAEGGARTSIVVRSPEIMIFFALNYGGNAPVLLRQSLVLGKRFSTSHRVVLNRLRLMHLNIRIKLSLSVAYLPKYYVGLLMSSCRYNYK